MQYIGQFFELIQRLLVWWVIVAPWENALHIRAGKHVKTLKAGIYLRVPFLDTVYVQPMRLRIQSLAPQTVSTKDGQTVTVVATMGYSICDLQKLFNTISHPESTLCSFVMSSIAECIAESNIKECTPRLIEDCIARKSLDMDYGIKFEHIKITGFAVVKTFRLIQDSHWMPNSLDINTPIK